MAYCEYCGEALSNDANYCPKCGANISFTSSSQSSNATNNIKTAGSAVASTVGTVVGLGVASSLFVIIAYRQKFLQKL